MKFNVNILKSCHNRMEQYLPGDLIWKSMGHFILGSWVWPPILAWINFWLFFFFSEAREILGLKPHAEPLRPWFFFLLWTNFGTSWVMKAVVKFHQNCVCRFGEESKYLFWGGTTSPVPIDPFNERRFWCGRFILVHYGSWWLWPTFIKIVCLVQAMMSEVIQTDRQTDWLIYSLSDGQRSIA